MSASELVILTTSGASSNEHDDISVSVLILLTWNIYSDGLANWMVAKIYDASIIGFEFTNHNYVIYATGSMIG